MALLALLKRTFVRGKEGWTARVTSCGTPIAYRREPARSAVGFFVAECCRAAWRRGLPWVYDLSMRAVVARDWSVCLGFTSNSWPNWCMPSA